MSLFNDDPMQPDSVMALEDLLDSSSDFGDHADDLLLDIDSDMSHLDENLFDIHDDLEVREKLLQSDEVGIYGIDLAQGSHRRRAFQPHSLRPPLSPSSSLLTKELAKQRIDGIMASLNHQIQCGKPQLNFSLRPLSHFESEDSSIGPGYRIFSFPGSTPEESWRFSVTLKILDLMHEALKTAAPVSKRDVFYHDPALFATQATIDRHVDMIASAFGVTRADLNVTAAAKGLIAGALTLHHRNGALTEITSEAELMPSPGELLAVSLETAEFILVVEKEATFRSILSSNTWQHVRKGAIVMTAKGYPDLVSRQLLHAIATPTPFNQFHHPAVYLLTDFDPDGVAIANTYKYGSAQLAHEGASSQTAKAHRIGLTRHHITDDGASKVEHALLPLTGRDRRKAKVMLRHMSDSDKDGVKDDIADLHAMLMLNVRAELQLLDERPDGLERFLSSIVSMHDGSTALHGGRNDG
ncbi:hypothetical protein B9Z65_1757 [Elsinoe australis]|uniref:DNA topoisomerase (ATP-hydrolyzing) n=1 Tax=Elsinoe australis TaxID=40998 RepID=A0A2P7YKV7_9PEZI|nr:hypothetical protein B9Z65_1757 [Elsinoe australis]